jgi:hypothetical protein
MRMKTEKRVMRRSFPRLTGIASGERLAPRRDWRGVFNPDSNAGDNESDKMAEWGRLRPEAHQSRFSRDSPSPVSFDPFAFFVGARSFPGISGVLNLLAK